MADDLEAPDETGIPGDEPFENDGGDYDQSPPPRLGGGCFFCNHPRGECMSPGDHCPLAKKMFAPKVEAVAGPELFVPTGSGTIVPSDRGGAWVVHGHVDVLVSVFADELSALRAAIARSHQATFVEWGGDL